jgi:signal recognition particle receptor subunit beta
MVSMKTKAERTLFFDLLPINRGSIGDFRVRFLLYTVPGQVYYNATRKLVLKGADAIVFVADSQRSQLAANMDSLRNLRTNLLEYGMCLDDLPFVISYNKRDMPDAMPMEELERELNPYGVPSFPSVAVSGEGVFEAFEKVGEMLMQRLEVQLRGDAEKAPARQPAPARPPVPASRLDDLSVREVGEAIQAAVPPLGAPSPPPPLSRRPAPPAERRPAPSGDDLILTDDMLDVFPQPAKPPPPKPEIASPAPPRSARPAALATDRAQPVVVEKSIVIPVSASELAGGKCRVRIVLDVTLDASR